MAFEVTARLGDPIFADYTPGSAVAAGAVVVLNNMPVVAHVDIAANELGAVAVWGGVYEATGDAAISVGKKVYWDDTNNKVTETSSGNKGFGWTVSACSGNNATCLVLHSPF